MMVTLVTLLAPRQMASVVTLVTLVTQFPPYAGTKKRYQKSTQGLERVTRVIRVTPRNAITLILTHTSTVMGLRTAVVATGGWEG